MKQMIELIVNGEKRQVHVGDSETLLDVLREQLNLTGTKRGCDQGDCGACTVLIDDRPVNSCLVLAVEVVNQEILTIEGLSQGEKLHPLQQAFIEQNAIQCGYCTPGMILTAVALLKENHNPSREEIRYYLEGNLCRCTGYTKIVEAIEAVSRQLA